MRRDRYKKDAFPTDKVYGDTHGSAQLRLITCGGSLTADRHWDSDVVVFAHLTGRASGRGRDRARPPRPAGPARDTFRTSAFGIR
ncbi:hypothetical protein ADK52_16595 [Streptomyces sp. WM6372]|uniref:hypothetical protein n=1 Tax=Streptomyces sp. WM6372 TaxID=1415555 RepID=UPI0006AD8574|nr:hypothetical protein [Streptomyces sp. WM6372]KOU23801.1 hypothetical protein ADK52_16595 [Streptomyces sp. WM6372]